MRRWWCMGGRLKAIDFEAPIASAQVKTAVLFAGLAGGGRDVDCGERADAGPLGTCAAGVWCGAGAGGRAARIEGGQKLKAVDATVPGDMSSAAFFLCAALLFEDSNLVLDSLGMNPTRAAMLDVISAMGGVIKVLDVQETHGEMAGTIQVNRGRALAGHRH